jgi:hypothetical protein
MKKQVQENIEIAATMNGYGLHGLSWGSLGNKLINERSQK